MLWVLVAIFMGVWVIGLATSYTMDGYIHIFLALAAMTVVVRLIQGRRIP